ncbi:MAG: UDP-N-acetylmuramate--L-alanine ligase [Actinomycetota bacterium]|nr:UDP-N-acetylmuramate--L-alanine ligase [Actinomycetota bacterium]
MSEPLSDEPLSDEPLSDGVDLSRPRRIHLIGVGGSGMSAIAEILAGTGHRVSGSDLAVTIPLQRLVERGLVMHVGHDARQIVDAEIVAVSTAIPPTNPEVVAAVEAGIPVLRRAELLTVITAQWRTVAVAGTHGKTTTSAMLTACLIGAGLDPAFIVGGDLTDLGRGAAVGTGEVLVVEADESDGTFVELAAAAVLVTNVEPDHLEHYGGFPALEQAFVRFVEQCTGPSVICLDDPGAARLAARVGGHPVVTYGAVPDADYRIVDPMPTPVGIAFTVQVGEDSYSIRLRQPGMHNARNATAAFAMAIALGAEAEAVAEALSRFGGVGRRFEDRGSVGGIRLVDDYAHLPTEVASALDAARSLGPDRVFAVFQPHRYSRTEQLWSTFGDAFVDADVLVVTGLYSAGERPREGIGGHLIAEEVSRQHPDADVRYVESLDDVVEMLVSELRPGDLCITLGAGDLTHVPTRVLPLLAGRAASGV